jgi:hypothetical protein
MNKKYLIFTTPILLYLGLKYWNLRIIPDFFGLYSAKADDYFGLILNLTASILGVLIAVVLLMFQMNKDTFLRRKGENFMEKPMIFIIVVVSLSILILGFVSFVTIPEFSNDSQLTLGYFIGYLFVGFIALIFPAISDILYELNTLKIVRDRIQALIANDFFQENQHPNDYITLDPDHSLYRIRHELIMAVRESDYEAYTEILSYLSKKATQLFGNADNRIVTDGILKGLTFIWQESIFEASRNNVQQFYKSLWDNIGALYSYASEKKAPLLHFQEIEHFIYEHIQFLGRNNMGDALTSGIWILADAFSKNLTTNRPSQEQISDIYDLFEHPNGNQHNIDASIQWDYIERFIGFIHDIQRIAISNQDRELYQMCNFHTNNILNDISHNFYGKLGNYQEGAISLKILGYGQYHLDQAFEAGLFKTTMGSDTINTSFTKYAIEKKEFYVKEIMKSISDYIIIAQRKGRLDRFTIQMFGAIGRHASKFYLNNDVASATIKFIVRTLKLMKDEVESNQLPEQKTNYEAIKRQLESQKDYLLLDNPNLDDPISTDIQNILADFMNVVADTENNIVSWDE